MDIAPDDRHRPAKIRLRMTWWVGERYEHLAFALFPLPDAVLHDGVAAGEAWFVPQYACSCSRHMPDGASCTIPR